MCGFGIYIYYNTESPLLTGFCTESDCLLKNRGPDYFFKKSFPIGQFNLCIIASVLWLQGSSVVHQPVIDENDNILLWNGDVFYHRERHDYNQCDTLYILSHLKNKSENEIVLFMAGIKGPWAFAYFSKLLNKLYFGRDCFGRHSLLWNINCFNRVFAVTSISGSNSEFSEVPALGIYYIDFNKYEEQSVYLLPWNSLNSNDIISYFNIATVIISPTRVNLTYNYLLNENSPSCEILEWIKELGHSSYPLLTYYEKYKCEVEDFVKHLKNSIYRRVEYFPKLCLSCSFSHKCPHSKTAILFSGGIDSTVIAYLAHCCLPLEESIDLLNVAFSSSKIKSKEKNAKPKLLDDITPLNFNVPDRITGKESLMQLCSLCSHRQWNFVEINIDFYELHQERDRHIKHLLYPHTSVLDDSIGCALWFAARGKGLLQGKTYTSPARVILCGMGADEQLGGYSRHRGKYESSGWNGLVAEMKLEMSRIHERNLGRDNRIIADHGRAPRFPFLDEDVVSFLNATPVWVKTMPSLHRSIGDKILLRATANYLGLTYAASLSKRAIQFGSRIAKLENTKEKGSDICQRLSDGISL